MHYTTSCNTQSSAPEDGRDYHTKHVELIGIINKPLLLDLVGVYIIYINDARSKKYQILWLYFPVVIVQARRKAEQPFILRTFRYQIIANKVPTAKQCMVGRTQ